MINHKYWFLSVIFLLVLFLGACSGTKNQNSLSPEQVYTQAAETVQAQLTQMAEEKSTPTAEITNTKPAEATETPAITDTPSNPTATAESQPTEPVACLNRATFVEDITYPDGAQVTPGEQFTKTWKMMNAGTCTWTTDYKIILISSDGISSPAESPLTTGIEVPAGAQFNISVTLQAPEIEGTYSAYFKFQAPDGTVFGINSDGSASFFVKIKVSEGSPTMTPTVNPTETPTIEPTATP